MFFHTLEHNSGNAPLSREPSAANILPLVGLILQLPIYQSTTPPLRRWGMACTSEAESYNYLDEHAVTTYNAK